MVAIKWSDAIKGPRVKVYVQLWGGLYKEYRGYIIPWSGTEPDANINSFTWSNDENDWISPGDQYNEDLNNWQGTINNGQFRQKNLKEKRNTEYTCSKYADSVKFSGIPREGKPEITTKSYMDQCCEHMIRNVMRDVLSITDPQNKSNK